MRFLPPGEHTIEELHEGHDCSLQEEIAYLLWEAVFEEGFEVVVTNGTGDGYYVTDEVFAITADPAPAGKRFKQWTCVSETLLRPQMMNDPGDDSAEGESTDVTEYLEFVDGTLRTSATAKVRMPGQVRLVFTAEYEDAPKTDSGYDWWIPAPTEPAEEEELCFRVACSNLNVRAGAGTDYPVLGRVRKGACLSDAEVMGDWIRFELKKGVYGYVSAE